MSALSAVTVDDDLPKVWALVIERCNVITDWDLNEGKDVTVDQVLARINPPKQKSSAAKDEAKAIFKRTLVCVQRFGSFAANTASMVFGPSQQCFNAISFVITAIQSYDEVFQNITALMERVSVFLEKLRVYLDDTSADVKLDKRLRKTVYKVLEHFLVIMGKSHKLTKGWKGKLKLAAKVGAFGEDDGIKSALGKLETLVSDVISQEISVIVQGLSEAARNIRGVDKKLDALADAAEKTVTGIGQLTAAEDKRATAEQEKKDLEAVKAALGVEDDSMFMDQQSQLWETHVPGTGQWLLNFRQPPFARWANPKSPALHLIPLKAPGGYGKSFLSSIVINHLHEKHKDDARVMTAFCYYPKETDSLGKATALNKVVKSIIWQFASNYKRDYLKAVAKACVDRKPDFSKLADVWKRFVTEIAKSIDATFYIVLDGVEDLDSEREDSLLDIIRQIRTTEDDAVNLTVRMFLTGTPEVIDSLMKKLDPVPEIDLASAAESGDSSFNETDLHLFIEHRLKELDLYNQSGDDPEIAELKEDIKKKLSAGVRGDYSTLGYKLDEISDAYSFSDVRAILERAGETRQEAIAREINRLNDTLSRPQILVVNRLLAWSSASYRPLSIKQYENIISLGSEASKMISLEREIRERYAGLFVIKDNIVQLRTDDIKEYLTSIKDVQSGTRGFEKAEVDIVRRVLRTHFGNVFGGDDLYQKYKFEEFFDLKLADEEARIRLDAQESEATATLGCLMVMCERYDEPSYSAFFEYANEWFADHLHQLELENIEVATRQDIGRKLVRLLREPELIKAWWTPDRMFMAQFFVFRTNLTRQMFNWLKDKDVQKGMPDMPTERQWVIRNTGDDAPIVSIFCNVAKFMAARWLNDEEDNWFLTFAWLRGYVALIGGADEVEYDPGSFPLEATDEVEKFARAQLPDDKDEARWHKSVGRTHHSNGHYAEAVQRFAQALELSPNEWQINLQIARAHAGNEVYDKAIEAVEECIKRKDELFDTDEEFTKSYWDKLLLSKGEWNLELKLYPAAETAYREVMDHGLKLDTFEWFTRSAIYDMISVLNKQDRHEEMITMLNGLRERREEGSASWLGQLFNDYAWNDWFHHRLHSASKSIETYQGIKDIYEHSIAEIRANDPESVKSLQLQVYFGTFKWRHGPKDDQDAAIFMWEQDIYDNLKEDATEADTLTTLAYTTRFLASALLDRAKQTGLSFPLSSEAEVLARRMKRLAQKDDHTSDWVYRQSKLMMARMYHLAQDNAHAKSILRDFVKEGFELAETDGSEARGYRRLGTVLQILDDDENALAAWGLMMPDDPDADEDEEKDENKDKDEDGSSTSGSGSEGEGSEVDKEEKPKAEAKDIPVTDANESAPITPPTSDDDDTADSPPKPTTDDTTTPSADTPAKPKYTSGPLADTCDGLCGKSWDYADDIYICKDCLSMWFCPECHEKLRAATREFTLCSSEHTHLHVPAFDEARWKATPKGQVWVGGRLVEKKEWLAGLRKEWQLDEPSLRARARLVSAVRRIQKGWRAFKGDTPPPSPSMRGAELKLITSAA